MTLPVYPPKVVSFLARVVDQHCEKHSIRSELARESVAASALNLYSRGITDEAILLRMLEEEDDPDRLLG